MSDEAIKHPNPEKTWVVPGSNELMMRLNQSMSLAPFITAKPILDFLRSYTDKIKNRTLSGEGLALEYRLIAHEMFGDDYVNNGSVLALLEDVLQAIVDDEVVLQDAIQYNSAVEERQEQDV